MPSDQKTVLDFYIEREKRKGHSVDLTTDHNVRVIRCCNNWELDACISLDEFQRLVIVDCPESKALLANGRLLAAVAGEARLQLGSVWKSGWNATWINKIISDLRAAPDALAPDPLMLRTKVSGEPLNGSYYVQDGNHRILAAGAFFLETGVMPDLSFHIGTIDENCFRAKQ